MREREEKKPKYFAPKNDPKIVQQTDNGTSITNLSKTEQKSDPKSTEKSGKTSKPYPKGTVYILGQ